MRDGGVQTVDHADGEDIVEILGVKVLLARRVSRSMICAAAASEPQLDRREPLCRAVITSAFLSMGKNFAATARCTRQTSSALQTEGRLVLAFSRMRTALSRSAY